jgi:hypothetical protein
MAELNHDNEEVAEPAQAALKISDVLTQLHAEATTTIHEGIIKEVIIVRWQLGHEQKEGYYKDLELPSDLSATSVSKLFQDSGLLVSQALEKAFRNRAILMAMAQ